MNINLPLATGFQPDLLGAIGYTILNTNGTTYLARTTSGITEQNETYAASVDIDAKDLPLIVKWDDSSSQDVSYAGIEGDEAIVGSSYPVIPSSSANLSGWKQMVVLTLRHLTGDIDPSEYEYSDERFLQLFLVASSLVSFDIDFSEDYEIQISAQEIIPDPEKDKDFITLGCLKAACILLTSEGKSASGCKISMKDGPSSITVDKSDLIKTLKDMSKSLCDKYEEAAFLFKQEGTLGVAIFGPHGIGIVDQHDTRRNFR